jgi:aminopeptidase N
MVRDAELAPGDYLALVFESVAPEREISLVQDILNRARQAIDVYGRPDARDKRLAALAARCLELLDEAEAGGDLQLAYARAYAGAVARPADVERVSGWLDGAGVPEGLAVDTELRWLIVRRLAAIGAIGEAEITAEHARDQTSSGAEWAAVARASLPTQAAKAEAWEAIFADGSLSNNLVRAAIRGFWQPDQEALWAPYAARYFAVLADVWRTRTPVMAEEITEGMFPAVAVSADTVRLADDALAGDRAPGQRRLLVEGRADLERALRARAADG